MLLRALKSVIWSSLMITAASFAQGQNYPTKTIRIITTEAGSAGDFTARLIAQGISGPLGQPVIVENQAPTVYAGTVGNAPPDGYTIAFGGGILWLAPLTQKITYSPLSPVTMAVSYPHMLAMNPAVPAKTVKELIDLAKAKPGELNFGATPDPGASSFLAAELFKAMAGVNIVRVSYKGAAQIVTDLLTNQVQLTFIAPGTVMPHVKSGKLRALAIASLEPSPLVPGLPTVAATGLPGFESISSLGILAPPGTPAPVINRLNQEIVRVLNRADVKEKMFSDGFDVVANSPEQFAAKIKAEITKWGKVLKDAGVKLEL